jgi:glycosyltransferase involved in cell wall biosynthesis
VVTEMGGRQRDLLALRAVRRRLRAFAPDVVHVQSLCDPRLLLAADPRIPVVLTLHDLEPHPGHFRPGSAVKRWAVTGARDIWRLRADAIVVHSERLRPRLRLRRGQISAVVPHGLDVAALALLVPGAPAVGLFGRLEAYKGLEVLAAAMPFVWRGHPEVRVLVAGSGPITFDLADARVEFHHRYVPEAELEALHRRTTLVVLPYTEASQSGAGSVAVGHGIPIVASELGGLPDLTLDGSYVVAPGDPAALAAAISAHIGDGADVRSKVLDRVARPHSWASVARVTSRLYEQLVAGRSGPRDRC